MARDSGRPGRRVGSPGRVAGVDVAMLEVAVLEVAGPGITGHAPRDTGNGPDRFRPASRGTAPWLIHGDARAKEKPRRDCPDGVRSRYAATAINQRRNFPQSYEYRSVYAP